MRSRLVAAVFLILTLGTAGTTFSEPLRCTECGMMVDNGSKFSAQIIQGPTTLNFCDIGDMFSYIKRKAVQEGSFQVKDFASGDQINAKTAVYVKSDKHFRTPMGWGIAAFRQKDAAAAYGPVLDFDAVLKSYK